MAAETARVEGESHRHLLPDEFRRIQELVLVLAEDPSCRAARLEVLEARLAEAQRDNAALRTVNAQLTAAVSARNEHIAALTQTAAATEKLRQAVRELEVKHAAEIKELETQVYAGVQLLSKTRADAADELSRERKATQTLWQQQNVALQQQVEAGRQQLDALRHSMVDRDMRCADEVQALRRQLAEARTAAATSNNNESASLAQMHDHFSKKLHNERVARDQTVGQLQGRISELARDLQAARMQRTRVLQRTAPTARSTPAPARGRGMATGGGGRGTAARVPRR